MLQQRSDSALQLAVLHAVAAEPGAPTTPICAAPSAPRHPAGTERGRQSPVPTLQRPLLSSAPLFPCKSPPVAAPEQGAAGRATGQGGESTAPQAV